MARQIRLREEGRWRGRPVASFLVRALTLLVPVGAGVVIAMAAGSALPAPTTTLGRAVWWALVLGSSTGAALLADRLARRLLPLAVLLKLTLVFPDRAPSRYVLARAAGNTRLLERRVREARERGLGSDPAHAAEMVLMLVAALSAHDRRTRGHSERVRAFVDLLADELHMPSDARSRLRWAALLHDIGKLQVEAEVLNKREQLDDDEWKAIHAHPEAGARLAGPLLPWLGEWGRAIVDHHERFDGTGYPNGISGEEISVAGRITAIADSFETMTAARAYKKSMSVAAARRELTRCAGTQFDPGMVRAFLNISIGRLMWLIGPATWMAQVPFVRKLLWAGQETATAAKSAALAKTLAGLMAVGMSGAVGPGSVPPGSVVAPRGPDVVAAELPGPLTTTGPAVPERVRDGSGADVRPPKKGGGGGGRQERGDPSGEWEEPPGSEGGESGDDPSGSGSGSSSGLIGETVGAVQEVVDDVVEPVVDDVVDTAGGLVDDVAHAAGGLIDDVTDPLP